MAHSVAMAMADIRTHSLQSQRRQRAVHISSTTVTLLEQIASGAAGTVWRGRVAGVRGDLAIKVLTCTELDQNMVNTIAEEIELSALFSMNCPNIVQCKGYSIRQVGYVLTKP